MEKTNNTPILKNLILTIMGLTAGNFLFQGIYSHDWMKALDQSVYQMIALGTFWLFYKIDTLRVD